MSTRRPTEEGDPEHLDTDWRIALHEAIVADTVGVALSIATDTLPPEHVVAVRDCLVLLERARRTGHESTSWALPAAAMGQPLASDEPRRIGRFEIVSELGRGGHGIVFLAFDPSLRRQVAIKLPRPETLASPDMRRRFLREAYAAAKLTHPAIVGIHEIGEAPPTYYLVSDYCSGGSLQNFLRDAGTLEPATCAATVRQLCLGVQYAHERGILHRDLKPSNVLLAPSRANGMPAADSDSLEGFELKLIDFGLARVQEQDGQQTASGTVLGTPAYMAPEQAEGRLGDVCAAPDVYGLGCVLYEMLVGRAPFQGVGDADILRQVLFSDPVKPRTLREEISRDLEAVCLRALDKDVRRRYSSAAALGDDLDRYLQGLPTLARPATAIERLVKWSRRHRAWATAIGLGISGLISLIMVLIWSYLKVGAALETARNEREQTRRYAYGADMRLAQENWDEGLPAESMALLEKYRPQGNDKDLRGVEWHYLWQSSHRQSQVVARQPTPVWALAVSPSNTLFATGDTNGILRLWQLDSPMLKRQWQAHDAGSIDCVLFGSDEKTLISGGDDHTIRFWDVATGSLMKTLREHTDWVGALALSPDKQLLASGGGEGRVLLWNTRSGELVRELKQHQGAVRWLVFHPVQTWLASASEDGEVHLWDYEANHAPSHIKDGLLESRVNPRWRHAAFAPGPRGALVAADGPNLLHWQVNLHHLQGEIVLNETLPSKILSLAMVSDATITGHEQRPEIIVRAFDGTIQSRLVGHSDAVRCLAPLNDDQFFLSGSEDGTVRYWKRNVGETSSFKIEAPSPIASVGCSEDSTCLALGLDSGQVLVFQDWKIREPKVISGFEHQIASCIFVRGNDLLFVLNSEGSAWWVDVSDSARIRPAFRIRGHVDHSDFDPETMRLAYCVEGSLHVIDASTGHEIWHHEHPQMISGIRFQNSSRLITSSTDGIVRLFDATNGRLLRQSDRYRSIVSCLNVSRNRQRLMITCDRTIRILDVATLAEVACLGRPKPPAQVFFFDHDRRLLLVDDVEMEIVNPETGQTLLKLPMRHRALGIRVTEDDLMIAPTQCVVEVLSLSAGDFPNGSKGSSTVTSP